MQDHVKVQVHLTTSVSNARFILDLSLGFGKNCIWIQSSYLSQKEQFRAEWEGEV